jgi:Fe-S-cluster-containing hydrogenase component 2
MGYDSVSKKVINCDFCDGNPACARFCSTQAIKFVDASKANMEKKRIVAESLPERMKKFKIC